MPTRIFPISGMNGEAILLGVNIDHIATLRQARGNDYPCPVAAALLAEQAGADGITAHLREDRRHIQDTDIEKLNARLATRLNLEMAATEEMLAIAQRIKPAACCLVPEKRQELTTEGGLDVLANGELAAFCGKLASAGIQVSLFIDPDFAQIDAAVQTGAPVVELHTGAYANNANSAQLHKIQLAAKYAKQQGLQVNAGHGLHLDNVAAIAAIAEITELNIGHALIAHAAFVGLPRAVADFKQAMLHSRQ